jgi:hypothetical protein
MSLSRSAPTVVALVALALSFVACAGTESFLASSAAHAQSPTVDWRRRVYFLKPSQFRVTLTTSCAQGEHVISGGYRLLGKAPQLEFLRGSLPTPDLSGWQLVITGYVANSPPQEIIVYAACTSSPVT